MFQYSQSGTQCVLETESSESRSIKPIASTASGGKQPTYTPVGSIYNPDATTPIQPPTRRPRARRYQPTVQSPVESSLTFQNTLLAALPVKDTTPTSPTPGANRAVKYSQLQQNYDRAISPPNFDERNAVPSGFGMSAPSIRSGNLPPQILGLGIAIEEKQEPSDVNDNGKDILFTEEVFPIKQHFSTPTLTNLASFPNPMQQAARNTLAKARCFNRSTGRADTPASLSQMASESARNRAESIFGPPSTTIGTPRPLEAGPPGRRQFIPSSFDGTVKAMRLVQEGQSKLPRAPACGIQSNLASGLVENTGVADLLASTQSDSYGGVDLASYFSYLADTTDHSFISTGSALLPLNTATVPLSRNSRDQNNPPKRIYDTLAFHAIKNYYPHGPPTDYVGKYDEIPDNWIKQYPLHGNDFMLELGGEDEKLARINRKFYSGTNSYINSLDRTPMDYDHHGLTKSIGVIGGERQRYQKRQDDTVRRTDGKIQPRHLSIEEAKDMDDSVHAAPFLSMAYGTLMQWKECSKHRSPPGKGWGPDLSQMDPAYVDTSDGGNNSFFSQEKPDLPKKKKLFKKVRRGY